uniref:Nucleoprotein n=1 Tax=Mammarenavirus choriomeningitidis TaxID=3052303 RepID=A0A344X2I1_9VIRU|nr:nucleoprotein [Mammarenavirus choriomeningitidis]AXE71868.1 nucleoprotein [Mammarenavirus choriomeningitidis]AXE71872.1 nucleoprotein [Mammarenavirus choriomeningitidis]WJM98989.1 nucleoprotein [Mammarenavirus choriomeningitidis]WJM98993.1 nucleoprotein [Mammarenavirus choriomeningitidis]
MSLSKEVKSFQWTQALRRELQSFTSDVKAAVIKDATSLLNGLDFSEVSNVQRIMRKEKRDDKDLQRLRSLNQTVYSLVDLKSASKKNVLKVGRLSAEELMSLAADLEKLKAKIMRSERPQASGVYMGNLTTQQLDQRSQILQMVGMRRPQQGATGVVRVWDVKDSSLLNNQFGTMPSLTMACMAKQSQTPLNDVVQALTDLGLLYTVKYPNLNDLERLKDKHPVLGVITEQQSSINISGYNFSLGAAVKAGAALLDGGNMLESILIKPSNSEDLLKAVLGAKRKLNMFVSDQVGDRNPYENILYKVCLSGEGWPYIACRTSIVGRAWENTTIDLTNEKPLANPPRPVPGAAGPPQVGLSYSQTMLLKDLMGGIDPNAPTWIDIEGRFDDPVEIAIFQPENGQFIHFYREPTDQKQFKQDSKYSHGMDLADLFNAQPGLTSSVIGALPQGMVLSCQGSDDIRKLLDSQNRRDIKLIDIEMTKEASREYEDKVWDKYGWLCKMHTGVVRDKKKKEITPHCALMDCIIFESASKARLPDLKTIHNILPHDLIFRGPNVVTL